MSEPRHLKRLKTRINYHSYAPTLGEIADAFSADVLDRTTSIKDDIRAIQQSDKHRDFKRNQLNKSLARASEELTKQYDVEFDKRKWPHYQLWILLKRELSPGESFEEIRRLLRHFERMIRENYGDTILWGGLSVIAIELRNPVIWHDATEAVQSARIKYFEQFVRVVREWPLDAAPQVPESFRKECVLIQRMIKSGIFKVDYDLNQFRGEQCSTSFEEAAAFITWLENGLKKVYGDKWAGWPLDWNSPKGSRRLLPIDHTTLAMYMADVLFRARGLVKYSHRGRKWSSQDGKVFDQAALLAVTAWRTLWSVNNFRRLEIEKKRRLALKITDAEIDQWILGAKQELTKARRAGQALLDSGNELAVAIQAHEVSWAIPNELAKLDNAKSLVSAGGFWVRQAGLTIDTERFPKVRKSHSPSQHDEDNFESGVFSNATSANEYASPDLRRSNSPELRNDINPFHLRIAFDQSENEATASDWALVLEYCPNPLKPGLGPLCDFVELFIKGMEAPGKAVSAAFNLSIRYSCIANAAKLLDHWPPDQPLDWNAVRELVSLIAKALEEIPYGLHEKSHSTWQEIIRRQIGRLRREGERSATPTDDWIGIHELLLGKCLSILRNAKHAREFYVRYHGLVSNEDVRRRYVEGKAVNQRGPKTMSRERLQETIANLRGHDFGTPTLISVVRIADESWNILGIDQRGNPQSIDINIQGDPFDDVERVLRTAPTITWRKRKGLMHLADQILEAADRWNPNSRWIAMAIEPKVATIPWQHLFLELQSDKIISLIPSLTWIVTVSRELHDFTRGVVMKLSDEDILVEPYLDFADACAELKEMRGYLRRDRKQLESTYDSLVVVCGHGTYITTKMTGTDKPAFFTSVVAERKPISISEWLDYSSFRIVIAHACFGGRTDHRLLGDYAGLPGTILGGKCRAFCAPVAKIPPDAITVLNTHISENGDKTLGARYFDAVNENRNVAIFNYYGLVTEPIRQVRAH